MPLKDTHCPGLIRFAMTLHPISICLQLHELIDDNWKLEVFGELEALKQQLSSLEGLDARLEAGEAALNTVEGDCPFQVEFTQKGTAWILRERPLHTHIMGSP